MSPRACSVEWCAALALRTGERCAAHTLHPVLNSFETRDLWTLRVRREKRASARAAAKQAEADQKLHERGVTS